MKKANLVLILTLFLLFTPSYSHGTSLNQSSDNDSAKNVILMIGDGMGFWHVASASFVEYGIRDGLFMQSPDFLNLSITTSSSNVEITDSAASATAIATGVKVPNGRLSVDDTGSKLPTILEYAESLNKSTGLVSTTRYNHATPAAFAVHFESRNDYVDIAKDMLTKDVEVILGGGEFTLPDQSLIEDNNYTFVNTLTGLQEVNASKILGVFENEHLKYEADLDIGTDVRLTDMVTPTLNVLSKNPEGFFLMIESGRIDHASHNRDLKRTILETIQFDYTIKMVLDFIEENPNTLLIVVADHETGGLVFDGPGDLDQTLPSSGNDEEEKRQIRITRSEQIDAYVPTTGHTAVPVPFLVHQNYDHLVDTTCNYNNAHLYEVMKNALDGVTPADCPPDIPGYDDPDLEDYYGKYRTSDDTSSTSSTTKTSVFNTSSLLLLVIPLVKKRTVKKSLKF